jgi:hypothetical protein
VSDSHFLTDLERWCDGTLSAPAAHALEQRLRRDASTLAEAQSAVQWHLRLQSLLYPASDVKQAWRPCAAQLSASRRQRIAQRVLNRWDTHRRVRWWPLAVAALVSVVITGAWWWTAEPGVVRNAAGKAWAIGQPQTVTEPAVLHWPDGSRCDLATGAKFTLEDMRTVTITEGAAHADIVHQTKGRSLRFTTPHGDVRVVGTRFLIDVGVRSSWVVMETGSVDLVAGTQHDQLGVDGLAELTSSGVRVLPSAPPPKPWSATTPIGRLFFTNSGVGTRTNPRAWFDDSTIDITSPGGRSHFYDLVNRRTEAAITGLAAVGGRHLIVNDLEGREGPGGNTYHASPHRLPILAPEMNSQADVLFARLQKAGITCGVPITHEPGISPLLAASELAAAADYAMRRWNLGFVVVWRAQPAGGAAGRSTMLGWLHRMCPELSLVIADAQAGEEQWGLPMRTLPSLKNKPNDPMPSVIDFSQFTAANRPDLSAWIKAGAIPVVNVWFPGPLSDYLKERRAGGPP